MKKFIEENRNLALILIGTCCVILIATGLFTQDSICNFWSFGQDTGVIGDTIGGISGPIIGLLTIALIYKTYTDQRLFINKSKLNMDDDKESRLFQSLMDHYREMKPMLNNENIHGTPYKEQEKIWKAAASRPIEMNVFLFTRIIIVTSNMFSFIENMLETIKDIKNENYRNLLNSMMHRFYKGSVQYHVDQLAEVSSALNMDQLNIMSKNITKLQEHWPNEKLPNSFAQEFIERS